VDTSIPLREVSMVRHRKFSAEFRVQAVRLLKDRVASGDTVERVAQEIDVRPTLLWAWAREVEAAPEGTAPEEIFPGTGKRRSYTRLKPSPGDQAGPESPEEELKRLRRENERLRQERDFLKKAAAFFAKESQ
jgi:transposase-like protein